MTQELFSENEIGKVIEGVVKEFDEHVGLGKIELANGHLIDFHCINIADGTRRISLGAPVKAEIFYHPRGRFEVKNIEKLV